MERDGSGAGAPTGSEFVQQSLRSAQIQRLYRTHNPEKLADIPALVEQYGEERLLSMVQRKYEAAPPSAVPASPRTESTEWWCSGAGAPVRSVLHRTLTANSEQRTLTAAPSSVNSF
jgi:hypothetical protein